MRKALATAILLAILASAQDVPFKSGISIVEIDAVVADAAGPIDGLKMADFAIEDNRQPVTLRYLSHDESALDVVLLFEVSRMMAPKLTQMRIAAEMAMAELRPGDRVAVMSFSQDARLELPLTSDINAAKLQVRNGLFNAAFNGRAVILPAADAAAKYLAAVPEPHGRKVAVMFTADAGSGYKDQSHIGVAQDFWEADASLSAMVVPTALTKVMHDTDPMHFRVLQQLALSVGLSIQDSIDEVVELTGGEVVYSADVDDIRMADNPYAANPRTSFRTVVQQLRHRYRLYYDTPTGKPGQRRQIRLELSPAARAIHPGARIVGRKGYVIPKTN